MKISVFGLGYIGTVSASCLADQGHDVIGVDKLATKVDMIRSGRSPIVEHGIDELVKRVVRAGRLQSTENALEAVASTDMSLVCVGTPSQANGAICLNAIDSVIDDIGQAIRAKTTRHEIVIRSTVVPGTTRDIILPKIAAASGKRPGEAFGLGFNPEFLRSGSSIADFTNPPRTIVGALDKVTAAAVMSLYRRFPGAKIITGIETAELAKYVDNAWHALKVTFANEVGLLANALALDSHEVMNIFCEDRELNISTAYLRPAFAFGGSCLPKDLRALLALSRKLELSLPVLESALESNRLLVERGMEWIVGCNRKRVAFLGISFKAGTDDLRESPFLELVGRLVGNDHEVRIYDPNVVPSRLVEENKEGLLREIPGIAKFIVSNIAQAIEWAETIVVTAQHPAYAAGLGNVRPDQIVLDFARLELSDRISVKPLGFLW
ncbi:MAG TPA: nucleotide sugar dehydrogenase [Xanthobacteraceae bacterium]